MSPSRFRVRGIFRGAVHRVARPFIDRNIHPNSITYLTLLFAFTAAVSLMVTQLQVIYGILVFMVGFFDGVDGAVARGGGRSSKAGAFTDSFIDKISEMLILLAIALAYPSDMIFGISVSIWVVLCISGWLLTSYARARAENVGVEDLDIGLGARSERLLTLVIFSLLNLIMVGLIVITLMGLLTAGYRFNHYKSEISSQNTS
ncbi:MAG: CDP-alcohol phosphatidyltransferase family protein [Candidatus Thorarchaeota archaeon]